MKPIYFPHTYVTPQTARAISVYFKSMVVYQASARPLPAEMQALAESGFLDVRIPDPSDQSRFDDVVKNFQNWGDLYFDDRSMKTAFSRSAGEPIPFFNESAASQIVADVKNELNPNQPPKAADAIFDARIFIEFAQEFDRQSHDIHQDLGTHNEKMRHLLAGLKGATDDPAADNWFAAESSKNDPGEFMGLKRLEAWMHLFEKDTAASGMLLAASRSLLEHLLDNVPTSEKIHVYHSAADPWTDPETLGSWRQNLMSTLTSLVKAKPPASTDMPLNPYPADSGEPCVSLDLYLIPDLTPLESLAACISKPLPRSGNQPARSDIQNTLIGLVQAL